MTSEAARLAAGVLGGMLAVACVRAELVDFWQPRGKGQQVVDERNAPITLRMTLDRAGYIFVERAGDGLIDLRVTVKKGSQVQFLSSTLKVACVDSSERVATVGPWRLRKADRLVEGVSLRSEAALVGAGEVGVENGQGYDGSGEYLALVGFDACPAGSFSIVLPRIRADGAAIELGSVTFMPQSRRLLRIDPV